MVSWRQPIADSFKAVRISDNLMPKGVFNQRIGVGPWGICYILLDPWRFLRQAVGKEINVGGMG